MRIRGVIATMVLLSLLTAGAAGCGLREEGKGETKEADKEVVTMLYSMDLPAFERLVEETYPDIDLQIEKNAFSTMGREGERRLKNGHGPDIVAMSTSREDIAEYLLDLSAEDYVSLYESEISRTSMINGRTLFLPMPGQYSGFIYNETLAKELGFEELTSPGEILKMLEKAKEMGLGVGEDGTGFGIVTADKVSIAHYLMGTQVPDFLGLAEGIAWSEAMLNRQGHFADGMSNCLDMTSRLVEQGYLNAQFLTGIAGNHVPVEDRMLEGSLLMAYGKVSTLEALNRGSGEYRYAALPFLSERGNHPWITAAPDAYLALNGILAQEGNEKRLDACHRILRLFSTKEGQSAVMEDSGAAWSYLKEPFAEDERVPQGLQECVEGGYVYHLRLPGNVAYYFGDRMVAVLNGQTTMDEAMDAVDRYYLEGDIDIDYDQSLAGEMAEDMIYENYNVRQGETAIGNLVADAVLEATGADFAFVNGGAIRASFYAGSVPGYQLDLVCPYQDELIVVETDAATIRAMLENGISELGKEGIPAGRFLNVSGLRYAFEWPQEASPPRLLSVTLPDGSALSEDQRYTIAVTDYMAGSYGYYDNNGDGYTMLNLFSDSAPLAEEVRLVAETDLTMADALQLYFAKRENTAIAPGETGRIEVVGKHEE